MRYNINWHNLQSEKPTKDGYYLVNIKYERAGSFVTEARFSAEQNCCFGIDDVFEMGMTAFYKDKNFKILHGGLEIKITDWAELNYPQER